MKSVLKIKLPYWTQLNYLSQAKTVIGIETSCDDTAVGIVTNNRKILAESKYNQWTNHKKLGFAKSNKNSLSTTAWPGGVIPNLARKLHYDNLVWAVSDCIEKLDTGWENIDAIALTLKPGLEPCLWEGLKFTKLLLKKYNNLKFIPIHHMEAHALTGRLFDSNIKYPFLTLLISGGHCLLALVENVNTFYKLGESLDISPGNCIDKIARQLGLYELSKYDCSSGGALLENYALNGDQNSFSKLTNSMQNFCWKFKDCSFSFSGLASTVFRIIEAELNISFEKILVDNAEKRILKENVISNICASVQSAITLQLEDRLKRGLMYLDCRNIKIEHVVVSGGVASNRHIRKSLEKICTQSGVKISLPPISYCTDNGVMIAWNGMEKLLVENRDIVLPNEQTEEFYESLKPTAKSELGVSIMEDVKLFKIKI